MPSCGYTVNSQRKESGVACGILSTVHTYRAIHSLSLWVNTIVIHVRTHTLSLFYPRLLFVHSPPLLHPLSTVSTPLTISTIKEKKGK